MSDQVNIENIVYMYMGMRQEKERLQAEYEKRDAEIKDDMDKLKELLLSVCNNMNTDSLKTKAGTVIRVVKERYTAQDWDAFYGFVLEKQIPQLLERRISQGIMKQYRAENPEDGLPPGVNVFREHEIVIRKPSNPVKE